MDQQTQKRIVVWFIGSSIFVMILGFISYILMALYATNMAILGGIRTDQFNQVAINIFLVLFAITAPIILGVIFLVKKWRELHRLRKQVNKESQQ